MILVSLYRILGQIRYKDEYNAFVKLPNPPSGLKTIDIRHVHIQKNDIIIGTISYKKVNAILINFDIEVDTFFLRIVIQALS